MIPGGLDPVTIDAALVSAAIHVPPGVDVGIPFAGRLHLHDDGRRAVHLTTRQGAWFITGTEVQRVRRLDSELDEAWDTSSGLLELVTWTSGREVGHQTGTLNRGELRT